MGMPWICVDCEKEFDTPETYNENVGEFWGAPAYMTVSCCPFCHSEAIVQADEYEPKEGADDFDD